jgi:hypothetical protein
MTTNDFVELGSWDRCDGPIDGHWSQPNIGIADDISLPYSSRHDKNLVGMRGAVPGNSSPQAA